MATSACDPRMPPAPYGWAFLHRKLREGGMDLVLSGAELCPVALVAGKWKKADTKERLASSALEGGTSHFTEYLVCLPGAGVQTL